jgi:hypothetical protein
VSITGGEIRREDIVPGDVLGFYGKNGYGEHKAPPLKFAYFVTDCTCDCPRVVKLMDKGAYSLCGTPDKVAACLSWQPSTYTIKRLCHIDGSDSVDGGRLACLQACGDFVLEASGCELRLAVSPMPRVIDGILIEGSQVITEHPLFLSAMYMPRLQSQVPGSWFSNEVVASLVGKQDVSFAETELQRRGLQKRVDTHNPSGDAILDLVDGPGWKVFTSIERAKSAIDSILQNSSC